MKSTARNRLAARFLFSAVALVVGGCSMTMTILPPAASDPTAPAIPATPVAAAKPQPKPLYLPANTIEDANTPKATTVNAFGELTRGGHARLVSDIALRQHTNARAGFDADACISPDGRSMVFSSSRAGGNAHLFRQEIEAGAATPLTTGDADDAQPTFSPDGKSIAFCSNRSGKWHLYLTDAKGTEPVQITDGEANDMHPSFSPDGKKLAYCTMTAGEAWQIAVIVLAAKTSQAITPGLFPAWSPSTERDVIVFQKPRLGGSRLFSLWTCELTGDDSGQYQAGTPTEIAASPTAALVNPTWSPDGAGIAYSSIAGKGKQDIWVSDASGSKKRRLTEGAGSANLAPAWGADNRVYFVSDRGGHENIWSLPARETSQRPQLSDPASAALDPAEVRP